jgi:hypothetical protein
VVAVAGEEEPGGLHRPVHPPGGEGRRIAAAPQLGADAGGEAVAGEDRVPAGVCPVDRLLLYFCAR